MKENPPKLGRLCPYCLKSRNGFEDCYMMVEPNDVVSECTDFELDMEVSHDWQRTSSS
ncbi:MAG: hypothetical protein DDT19_00084 [Syntrophomonadaceae bacterium]|nr:hypothetical protein [Bacillota bacterium]